MLKDWGVHGLNVQSLALIPAIFGQSYIPAICGPAAKLCRNPHIGQTCPKTEMVGEQGLEPWTSCV